MTLRTCDSSVIHIAAICGTDVPTLDANKIAARSRVAKCFGLLGPTLQPPRLIVRERPDKHLRRTHHHLHDRDASEFAVTGEFPVKPSEKGH